MAEIKVPELAESISEGTISQWLKQPGEYIVQGEYLVEVETDKVNIEITSEVSGEVKEHYKQAGDIVTVGEVIGEVDETKTQHNQEMNTNEQDRNNKKTNEVEQEKSQSDLRKIQHATPSARKLAREKGINLDHVPTDDPFGRVRKQHIEQMIHDNQQDKEGNINHVEQVKEVQNAGDRKRVERIQMTRRRKTIANRLVEAQQSAAMLTTFNEVDLTAIRNVRKKQKEAFVEEFSVKLGYMSFFTKAVVAGIKKFPLLNAEIDGDEIIQKKYYDIGVAVSTEEGLIVPVVRNADQLNFGELEKEIERLAESARNQTLKLEELQGGSFTITNGGVFGSLFSTPILNSPQVGILGMHKIQWRPVALDEETIENRPMMYIALSYDHRIIDGREAVGFLAYLKQLLENPETLLLHS